MEHSTTDGGSGQNGLNFVNKAHCVQVKTLVFNDFLLAIGTVMGSQLKKHSISMERLVHTRWTGSFQGPHIGQGNHRML